MISFTKLLASIKARWMMTTENYLLKTSQEGIDLIKKHEGVRLHAYRDSVGIPTIGYGHTGGVKMGDVITQEQADAFLVQDLQDAEEGVIDAVNVEITQGQFDALVSFVFNLGINNLKNSTLLKLLNSGDYEGAANQFKRWTYAGGKQLAGLVIRRNDEAKLFTEEA